jgi:hypothetical protein
MTMRFHHGYNSARIKPLATYAQAKAHYDSVVPIRGRDNVRPLGANRRYTGTQIVKNMVSIEVPDNPLGEWAEVYSCRLWGSDLISFCPNGDLVLDTKYRGVSVMNMLTYALSGVAKIGSMRGKWYLINKKNESFALNETKPTIFSLVDGDYVAKDPTPEIVYTLNRKEMNALRKRHKRFIEYACTALGMDSKVASGLDDSETREIDKVKAYLKIKDHDLLPSYYWNREPDFKGNQVTIAQALDNFIESGDLELAYNLMFLFAHNAGKFSYRDSSISCSQQAFKKYFDEFLKYAFRNNLFVPKEVEVGVPFYDANKKFMRQY